MEGFVEAETESIARDLIKEKDLILLKLELKKKRFGFKNITLGGIKRKDIVIFSRQVAVMVTANIPIVESLKVITAQTDNPKLQMILQNVYLEVEAGTKMSEAMAKHPKVFDSFYVNMVKSGETSGRLDEVLNYLADQLEKDFDLFRKVKGAMIYPIMVIVAMGGAGAAMMLYVVPKLVTIFESLGADLPWTTRVLLATSGFLVKYWWIVLLVIGIGALVLRTYYLTYVGKVTFSKIKFRIPVFGKLFKNIYILRFTRSLSTLLIGGVNLIDSLKITTEIVDDVIFQSLVQQTILEVQDGNSIVTTFIKSKFIPPLVSNMMLIGEQTGKLDYILEKLSDFYAKEIDATTENIMSLIEPLIMVVLGIGVAIMVAAIYLPLYTIPAF